MIYRELYPSDCEGLGWRDMERENPFDRVPVCLKELSHIWNNGHSTTGMCCFFTTDSTRFRVRLELAQDCFGEPNFNVCAFSGADLYMFDESEQRWRWAATYTDHQCIQTKQPDYMMLEGIARKPRRCRLYLPMRNQLMKIFIGLDDDADFEKVAPREANKLVYYGTSIIHGAYSTRSGLGIAQILARNLDMPLMNLGFSGGCRMDKALADLLVQLKQVRVLVVDPMHNVYPDLIRQNMPGFLATVCSQMPDTEIIVVSSPRHLQGWLKPTVEAVQLEMQRLLQAYCDEYRTQYANLHFIDGQNFYGTDEVSPDGIHPNDTAGWHMAGILTEEIRKILA